MKKLLLKARFSCTIGENGLRLSKTRFAIRSAVAKMAAQSPCDYLSDCGRYGLRFCRDGKAIICGALRLDPEWKEMLDKCTVENAFCRRNSITGDWLKNLRHSIAGKRASDRRIISFLSQRSSFLFSQSQSVYFDIKTVLLFLF